MGKTIKKLLYICCLIGNSCFAIEDDGYGVSEIDINLARTTARNVLTHLEYAVKVVESDIYPTLNTLGYRVTTASTVVYAYLVNTSGNTSTFTNWLTTVTATNSGSYIKNPYISKLAIVRYGLKIQMQFVSTNVSSTGVGTSAKIPIFEPFLGRRIMLIPIFNIVYSGTATVSSKDKEISSWTCLTDADETVATSARGGMSEGTLSVVAIAGGVLGACQYISAATMNTIWITI